MTRQDISFVFDLDGVLRQTKEMLLYIGQVLTEKGIVLTPEKVLALYDCWKTLPRDERKTFHEGFPHWIAQWAREQRDIWIDEWGLQQILNEANSRDWTDPEARTVLEQIPRERIYVVTCGVQEEQLTKLEQSGLLGEYIDPTHVTVVQKKDQSAFLHACTKMGIRDPMIQVNDRLDELFASQEAFPDSVPVWLGDRAGEQYTYGKEMEPMLSNSSCERLTIPLIRISSLGELPVVLREKGYL